MDFLIQEEFSEIVANGAFGKNLKFISFEQNMDLSGIDQYKSKVIFGTVYVSDGSNYPVLIKLKIQNKNKNKISNNDLDFHNELIMYTKILPFFFGHRSSITNDMNGPSLPKFFFGRNTCDEFEDKGCIILENVNYLGYYLTKERLFLDFNHLVNALDSLAKFHALSYISKYKDPHGFMNVISDIRDDQWNAEGQWFLSNDGFRKFGKRGIDRLLERNSIQYGDHEHMHRFKKLVEEGGSVLRRTLKPCEPLSVLCHGDFNRNNLMFRYDERGFPVDTLMFDFGTPKYGSPALDISFFLYMNTTQTMRETKWDDLMNAYCSSLAAALPSGIPVPDRHALDAEMATSALFGFAHASFFLPIQLENNKEKILNVEKLSFNNQIDSLLNCGGDVATDLVADMVQHFVDNAFTNT